MLKINIKKPLSGAGVFFLLTALAFAAALVGTNFKINPSLLTGGGGSGSSASYKTTASVGQGITGTIQGGSIKCSGGFSPQTIALAAAAASSSLGEVFVFPNPYKPNSGGRFDAGFITFKELTGRATIKVFNIAGELVATLEKTDIAVDKYEWGAVNDSGQKLASGVYIYLVTNPAGEKAKGKFAIIK